MIKDLLSEAGLDWISSTGLVLFVLTFVAILGWTAFRRNREVSRWSALPFEDDRPTEPQHNHARGNNPHHHK